MTRLYLVRHAIAFERGNEWPDDALRPVSHKGAARMREIVDGMIALGVELDVVVTSPLVRAKQTADLIIAGWPSSVSLAVSTAFAPGGSPAMLGDVLAAHPQAENVALVGHEPDLGQLAQWLIGATHPLPFKKGGVARIDVSTGGSSGASAGHLHGAGELRWLATPRMLRTIR